MRIILVTLLLTIFASGCSSFRRKEVSPSAPNVGSVPTQIIKTSYYAHSLNGRKTANGEIYRGDALTAAHRTYPFGTKLYLRNPDNGKSVVVRINDRGPFIAGRDLDISSGAAKMLGIIKEGVADLEFKILANST